MDRNCRSWVMGGAALLAVMTVLVVDQASAQSTLTRVTLNSGVVLEGTILEQRADGSLKMALIDGSLREVVAADVSEIRRPALPPERPGDSKREQPSPPSRPLVQEPVREGGEGVVQAAAEPAPSAPIAKSLAKASSVDPRATVTDRGPATESDPFVAVPDGTYAGGLVGGAAAPAFPGVAGIFGGEAFVGYRAGMLDGRVGLMGIGAVAGDATMGLALVRATGLLWVADAYAFGISAAPCAGYYEDDFIGGHPYVGVVLSGTPVALRFRAGEAVIEASLIGGGVLGTVVDVGSLLRPLGALQLAVYSR